MFWGLVLEPGKRYSTTVEKSFHVSKAVIDCSSLRNDNEILNVMLETEGSENILCNLCKQKGILQESLDLNFMTGDRLTFECRGNGRVHLSGYLLPEDDEGETSGFMDEESEDEEEEPGRLGAVKLKEKRKIDAPPNNANKKKRMSVDQDEEDDEDASDSDAEGSDLSDVDDEDLDDEEEDDDEGSDDEEEVQSVNQLQKKNKTPIKQNTATPKKTPVTNGMTPKEQKSNKKTPGGSAASPNATPKQKQVLEQGVVVKDLKVGSGQPVKNGKTVAVRYLGKLKETGKVFDKNMKGDGFKFKLGRGEVIRGWDIGVQGMKVGGKRIINCPAEAAYGARGAPPSIPPNSSLIFEVEVVNVY